MTAPTAHLSQVELLIEASSYDWRKAQSSNVAFFCHGMASQGPHSEQVEMCVEGRADLDSHQDQHLTKETLVNHVALVHDVPSEP